MLNYLLAVSDWNSNDAIKREKIIKNRYSFTTFILDIYLPMSFFGRLSTNQMLIKYLKFMFFFNYWFFKYLKK